MDKPVRGSPLRGSSGEKHRRAHLQQAAQFVASTLGAVRRQQRTAQGFVDADGRVRGRVGAPGNPHFNLAEGDFIGHQQRRFQAGAAGLLQVVGRGFGRQGGGQQRFAGQVEIPRVLDHSARSELAQAQAVEVVAVHQALQRGHQQILVAVVGVHRVGAGKRNAVAADNRHAARRGGAEAVVTHGRLSSKRGCQINRPRIWGLSPAGLRTSNARRGPSAGAFHRAT